MAVWCRQSVNGKQIDPEYRIEPHAPGQTDAELLGAKARGAADKGWTVEWTGESGFTATKARWEAEDLCVREFWID